MSFLKIDETMTRSNCFGLMIAAVVLSEEMTMIMLKENHYDVTHI
jgi:hypothetical protein